MITTVSTRPKTSRGCADPLQTGRSQKHPALLQTARPARGEQDGEQVGHEVHFNT